jgi:chromosome partitioning protein
MIDTSTTTGVFMTKNRIFLVGSEKGGVGKTSLSFNLAVLRAKAGHPVLLVDADKQASSAMWASLRTEVGHQPPLVCVQKLGKIGHDLLQLKENYDVIVDAGGTDSQELRQGIAVADMWVIPVRPGQLDLFSMAKMSQLMTEVEERVGRLPQTFVVLNAINSSTNEAAEARELLSENEKMPVMETQLVDRVAMRRAVMAGCGVAELTGSAKADAVAEVLALYEEVFGEPYHDEQK